VTVATTISHFLNVTAAVYAYNALHKLLSYSKIFRTTADKRYATNGACIIDSGMLCWQHDSFVHFFVRSFIRSLYVLYAVDGAGVIDNGLLSRQQDCDGERGRVC